MVKTNHVIEKRSFSNNIVVIGGGIIGSSTALYLAKVGFEVILIDNELDQKFENKESRTATQASLGVLMGNLFKRSKGRSWNLRQRSIALWAEWIKELHTNETPLQLLTPLIKVARSEQESDFFQKIVEERDKLDLDFLGNYPSQLKNFGFPEMKYGGIISYRDGRINPKILMESISHKLEKLKVKKIKSKVLYIQRNSNKNERQWKIYLKNKDIISPDIIVLCSGLGTNQLLKELDHKIPLEPILGQAIELKVNNNLLNWPSVLMLDGINLIPSTSQSIILGATLEPGEKASKKYLEKLRDLNGNAPDWIKNAEVIRTWNGIRVKPINQPAPVLKTLEPGLIVNTAHYRNGILLAPASAEWVVEEISKLFRTELF